MINLDKIVELTLCQRYHLIATIKKDGRKKTYEDLVILQCLESNPVTQAVYGEIIAHREQALESSFLDSCSEKVREFLMAHKDDAPLKQIPTGDYCYSIQSIDNQSGRIHTSVCPYWSVDNNQAPQNNGCCKLLAIADADDSSDGLLWDQIKNCGLNQSAH